MKLLQIATTVADSGKARWTVVTKCDSFFIKCDAFMNCDSTSGVE